MIITNGMYALRGQNNSSNLTSSPFNKKSSNQILSNPKSQLGKTNDIKQVSFRGWFKYTRIGTFFEGVKAVAATIAAGAVAAVIKTVEKFAPKVLENVFGYKVEKLSKHAEEAREKTAGSVLNSVDKKLSTIIGKNTTVSPEKIIEIYAKKLERVLIDLTGDGNEKGLNKVIGLAQLKVNLYNDVLMPLCETMDGKQKHRSIPNGISFFGPKGTGKTYFMEQLAEHYVEKGGYSEIIKLSSDPVKDIEYLNKIFSEAEQKYIESGKTKYTMILFDEVEKHLDKNNNSQKPTIARLLELTNNCKDRGIVFVSTSNYLDKVEPALLRTGRTDLRIPIGHIADYDMADIINYYLKADELPHSADNIDFEQIIKAVETEKLQYKPKDIESRLVREADNVADYDGELTTESIKEALVLSKPEFDEAEHLQFEADKFYSKQLGSLYEY